MFDIGLQEMLLIGVLALLVFGPSKLPELGRMVGRAMREFRRASDEFRSTVETNLNMNEPDPVTPPIPVDTPPVETPVPAVSTLPSEQDIAPVERAMHGAGDTTDGSAIATETPSEPYCALRGARLFHRRECSWVARMDELDRMYIKSVAEAREQGYETCPVCEPWEPA
jgi:TatA/E family protein of Tat protein translocase